MELAHGFLVLIMESNFFFAVLIGSICGISCYLILQASLIRILLGLAILSNGINLFIFASSTIGTKAPLGKSFHSISDYADPLPAALILTALVIGFGTISWIFSLILRINSRIRCDDIRLIDSEE